MLGFPSMREQLTKRLELLKSEFEKGQKKLTEVEAQASGLRSTLLRISGAIQVLEEELAKDNGDRGEMVPRETNAAVKDGVTADTQKVVNMTS